MQCRALSLSTLQPLVVRREFNEAACMARGAAEESVAQRLQR